MKKWLILLMVIAAVGAGHAFAHEGEEHNQESTQKKTMYHCPMHPEVNQDKPGKCPKCEMNLEKVNSKDETKHSH